MSSNYEVLTASPEALGNFLASLPVANSPWDECFSQTSCSSCEREDCDADGCPHQISGTTPPGSWPRKPEGAGRMDNEQMILQTIAQLTDTVTKGFQDMEGRFEGIESRLDGQERKLRRTAVRQQLQDSQIEELSRIVQDMAENAPLRSWDGSAAICKEDAYQNFEEIGVGRRIAMRALEKAGAIRADKNSRRTKVIRLDGKCQRVIIVEMGDDP